VREEINERIKSERRKNTLIERAERKEFEDNNYKLSFFL
jgi:hypothetical protein